MAKVGLKVTLSAITPEAELVCEKAARRCYDSVDKMKDASKLLKACRARLSF